MNTSTDAHLNTDSAQKQVTAKSEKGQNETAIG